MYTVDVTLVELVGLYMVDQFSTGSTGNSAGSCGSPGPFIHSALFVLVEFSWVS